MCGKERKVRKCVKVADVPPARNAESLLKKANAAAAERNPTSVRARNKCIWF
jgi:hypothetical protein